jgi:hypothetical protein
MSIANAAFTGVFVAEMLFKWIAVGGHMLSVTLLLKWKCHALPLI